MRNCSSAIEASTVHTSPVHKGRAGCRVDFRTRAPPSRRNCVIFVHNPPKQRRRICIHCRAKQAPAESATHLLLHNNGHVKPHQGTGPVELHGPVHSVHCAAPTQTNWNIHQSVEELEPRHLQLLEHGLLELVEHGHRDVNPQAGNVAQYLYTALGPL